MIVDIVFDGPPGPVCGRFVEVETVDGASVKVGEWIDRGNGLWALRIDTLPESAPDVTLPAETAKPRPVHVEFWRCGKNLPGGRGWTRCQVPMLCKYHGCQAAAS